MSRDNVHWLLVYLVPYFILGAASMGAGLVLIPLGGTLGIYVGFTSTAPYFTQDFKLSLLSACLLAISLFLVGLRFRHKLWGKIINSSGAFLWCLIGIVGFGPQ